MSNDDVFDIISARHGIQRMVELFEDINPSNYSEWQRELAKHLKSNDALKQLVVAAVVEVSEEIKVPCLEEK